MTDMNPSPAPSGASAAAEKPAVAGRLLGAGRHPSHSSRSRHQPTKKFGQNFVIDPGTVRRIVREAAVTADTRVLEVGPGLGSLTLAILETGATMTAVEIDPPVAQRLPHTIDTYMPDARNRLTVINKDALALTSADLPEFSGDEPFTLVANLPYNVATPDHPDAAGTLRHADVLRGDGAERSRGPSDRHSRLEDLRRAQREAGVVRLGGTRGQHRASRILASAERDSALAGFTRVQSHAGPRDPQLRQLTFQLVDAAFSQRRKTLHAALKRMVPDEVFHTAGIDPTRRGETLTIDEFAALATALEAIAA